MNPFIDYVNVYSLFKEISFSSGKLIPSVSCENVSCMHMAQLGGVRF